MITRDNSHRKNEQEDSLNIKIEQANLKATDEEERDRVAKSPRHHSYSPEQGDSKILL